MATAVEKVARKEASETDALGLIYGMLTSRHPAVYRDELSAWLDVEMKGVSRASLRRFLEQEFGEPIKRRAPDEPCELWEVAIMLRDSKWLRDGAKGIRKYGPRAIRRWLGSIIGAKQRWDELSTDARNLFSAAVDCAEIDVVIRGCDDQ